MSGDGEFVRVGECKICINGETDLYAFPGGVTCVWCGEEDFNKEQLRASELEACEKYYESEDWMPEDGFDEEDK